MKDLTTAYDEEVDCGEADSDEVFVLPATVAQQGFWYLDRLAPGNPAYNIPLRIRMEGNVDIEALQKALLGVIQRHESLRTTFAIDQGSLKQIVILDATPDLAIDDLSGISPESRNARAEEIALEESQHRFDLSSGPLVKCKLLRLAEHQSILFVTFHHVIADGWSTGVFLDDLAAFYDNHASGCHPEVPDLPLQYGDYAVWLEERLDAISNDQLTYWIRQLKDLPPLQLPTDRFRPRVPTLRGGIVSELLSDSLSQDLADLARRYQVTSFVLFLAVYLVLIHRRSGQNEFPVGTVSAGRSNEGLENLIGLFINPLVIRADFKGELTFQDLLSRVRDTVFEALDHQEIPFRSVVNAINPYRDPSRHPIFQAAFQYERVFLKTKESKELTWNPMPSVSPGAIFDLNLPIVEGPDGIRISIEYSLDLFTSETAYRMLVQYKRLLELIVERPTCPIEDLRCLPLEQERELLEWGRHNEPALVTSSLPTEITAIAERSPVSIAIRECGRRITYSEMDERADRRARLLIEAGVRPDALVALQAQPTIDYALSVLGILKAGAAFLPLQSSYSSEEMLAILEDSAAPFMVYDRQPPLDVQHFPEHLNLISTHDGNKLEAAGVPSWPTSTEDLACVFYPHDTLQNLQSVRLSHRALVRVIQDRDYLGFGKGAVVLFAAPFSDIDSHIQIWAPLVCGGELALASTSFSSSLDSFCHELSELGVTTLSLTASQFHTLVDERPSALKPLRRILVSSDVMLSQRLTEKAMNIMDDGVVIHLYEGKKSAPFACGYQMPKAAEFEGVPPVGRPLSGVSAYVLDQNSRVLPAGVPGELCLGGPTRAKRVNGQTSIAVNGQFAAEAIHDVQSHVVRTGQGAVWSAEGQLKVLGRLDECRQYREGIVDLRQIECTLLRHEGVRDALACVIDDVVGEKKLAAYYIDQTGGSADVKVLREYLAKELPESMVPTDLVRLSDWPKTRGGAIDSTSLPAPGVAQPLESRDQPPENSMETWMAEEWSNLLGLDFVGVNEDFFDLGGHSLLMMRLLLRIETKFGKKITYAEFMQDPTIRGLAERMANEKGFSKPAGQQVWPLRGGSTRLPLLMVDAGVSEHRLAQRLTSGQPVYGVEYPTQSELPENFTIHDVASNMADAICHANLKEPICLGGWSIAGVVAFETACELLHRGKRVARVLLFDAHESAYARRLSPWSKQPIRWYLAAERAMVHIGRMIRMSPAKAVEYYRKRGMGHWRKRITLLRAQVPNRLDWIRLYEASESHTPEPTSIPLVLFRSEDNREGLFRDGELGWGKLTSGGVQVFVMKGDHGGMFKVPEVERLATLVDDIMASAATAKSVSDIRADK